jgi:CRISPR system Cascade subunit CasB
MLPQAKGGKMSAPPIKPFIERLWKLESAELAELRRSLSFDAGDYPRVYRIVEQDPRIGVLRESDSKMYYLVAGLFAHTERPNPKQPPKPLEPRSLGVSVAELFVHRQKSKSIEDRFTALLDADMEQLQYRLRQMNALLKDVARVDWAMLLEDLLRWNFENKTTQRKWAKDFYRHLGKLENQQENPNENNA